MATQFSVKDGKEWLLPFALIYSGQVFSLLGSALVQFALIWYLTVQEDSATVLATASLAGMLPQVVLGPFVGTLVDRWNRRLTMILADSTVAAATLVLAVLFARGQVAVWHIYLVLFVRSLAGSFHGSAMMASTSLMVPVEHLTRVQGINQMLNGGLNIVSAPLGAWLLEVLPMQGILGIDIATAALAVLPLLFIPVPQPEARSDARNEMTTFFSDFMQGLRYVLAWRGLLILMGLAMLINFLLTPAFSLLALLVRRHFQGGAMMLGWLDMLFGVGVVAGGLLLGMWGGFGSKIRTSMFGLAGLGVGVLLLGLAPASAFWMALLGSLVVGVMQPVTNGPIMAILQMVVEPDMQARVFSLLISAAGAMSPLGLAIAGPLADLAGVRTWFVLGGILCLLAAGAGMLIPDSLHLEEQKAA